MAFFIDRIEPNGDRSPVLASPFQSQQDAESHVERMVAGEDRVDDHRRARFVIYEA